jgi:hypothetical protein
MHKSERFWRDTAKSTVTVHNQPVINNGIDN